MKHATVIRDGYKVPLLGIKPSYVEERCDCCGKVYPLRDLEYTGKQFLCEKCK